MRAVQIILWLVLVVAMLWLGGFLQFANTLPRANGAGGQADAVVVLTGGSARFEAGLSLLAAGAGKRMLVTGVGGTTDLAALRARAPQAAAQFDCCVDLGRQAVDTRSNAREARDWVRQHGFESLHLVTADYHMPRSLLLFATAMPDRRIMPHAVIAKSVLTQSWWRHPGTARLLALEYSKYLLSLIRIRVLRGGA